MKPVRNQEFDQPAILLGQQQGRPQLCGTLDRWQISGPVGLVSAGWEEDEFEDGWVRAAAGRPVVNARLYELADRLFAEDPEVIRLLRERQDELRRLRELNKFQLDHLLAVAREMLRREFLGEPVAVPAGITFEQVRQIDRAYLDLVAGVIGRYEQRIDPASRPSVRTYRERVLEQLNGCRALLIAGGHVGVLLNRLNLSGLLEAFPVPVIAWSGGAMVLGEKLVFFHHFVPHASGDAELSRFGMRWFRSSLVFPRADERLNLGSRVEVALLARRFSGDCCYALGDESVMEWSSRELVRLDGVRQLMEDGSVVGAVLA